MFDLVYILDDAYWIPVTVSAKSALTCLKRPESRIRFWLIADGVSEAHREVLRRELVTKRSEVIFVTPALSAFEGLPAWHGTKLVWTRCVLNELLPDLHAWVCICDGDTLWLKSPEDLFALAARAKPETVVLGSRTQSPDPDYFCMGFALMHFDRMRAFGTKEKCLEHLNARPVPAFLEQDVLNEIWRDYRGLLPRGWGVSPVCGLEQLTPEEIACVHYWGELPWPAKWYRRLRDVNVLWWHLIRDLMRLSVDDVRFRMSGWTYFLMRTANFLFPLFRACGLLSGCKPGVKLPLRPMLREMDERWSAFVRA